MPPATASANQRAWPYPGPATPQPIIRTLSERTIAQIRNEFPRWDIYALQAEFNQWLDGDPARAPKNYEAAFNGWVRQHHARNRFQVS